MRGHRGGGKEYPRQGETQGSLLSEPALPSPSLDPCGWLLQSCPGPYRPDWGQPLIPLPLLLPGLPPHDCLLKQVDCLVIALYLPHQPQLLWDGGESKGSIRTGSTKQLSGTRPRGHTGCTTSPLIRRHTQASPQSTCACTHTGYPHRFTHTILVDTTCTCMHLSPVHTLPNRHTCTHTHPRARVQTTFPTTYSDVDKTHQTDTRPHTHNNTHPGQQPHAPPLSRPSHPTEGRGLGGMVGHGPTILITSCS